MSADLFAAFMAEDEKPKRRHESIVQPITATTTNFHRIQPSTTGRSVSKLQDQHDGPSPPWERDNDGADVLFDADEPDFDDDFGDFETVGNSNGAGLAIDGNKDKLLSGNISAKVQPDVLTKSHAARDLTGSDDITQPAHPIKQVFQPQDEPILLTDTGTKQRELETVGDDDWGDFEQTDTQKPPILDDLNLGQTSKPKPQMVEAVPDVPNDGWELFDEEIAIPSAPRPSPPRVAAHTAGALSLVTTSQASTPVAFERPPNIPPPSSLLQLLSIVFDVLRKAIIDGATPKNDLAAQTLIVFRAASRIAVGRNFRWKRDTILAQSVRIGQAGKSGGMKLVTVNKSEITKEDRDTEDMIEDWSKHVHEFNSIVGQAGFPPQRMKISSKASLKTLKSTSGSDSSKQCAVCGLRRSERMSDVDAHMDDLFGEFWVEHWGHKDCYDFWYSYKSLLGQR